MEKEIYFNQIYNYLNSFLANVRIDDPLPVRAPNYRVTDSEIDGQIIDIVYHYLNHRECPPYIRSLVAHRVWAQIRSPETNDEDIMDSIDHNLPIYEPVKLIQDVTNRANVVLRDLQSKLSRSQVESMPTYCPVSTYSVKNTRRRMENRHVVLQDLNTLYDMKYDHPHSFYGVFDGHGGLDAAVYAAAHLHQYLIQNPLYEMDPAAALKHAFHITDTNFVKKASKERLKGGTTAVVALVREKRLVVAWLGDSQALLVRRRKPVQVVSPHRPDYPEEKRRIEALGGCIINIQGTWRVLGQLAVSRAIGDVDYKPFISSECDIKSLEISGDEDFLILGCDGIWDNLKPLTAVNLVYAYLNHNDGDTDGVGRCLVEAAQSAGSQDNITAVVVFLRPVTILMEEEAFRIAQGEVTDADQVVPIRKDAQPNFLNNLFSQPPPDFISDSTFETKDPRVVLPEELSPNFENNSEIEFNKEQDVPPPIQQFTASHGVKEVIYESDSDEGVGAEIEKRTDSPLEEAVTDPTAAEVDAALAELDSIPADGGESSEDDGEWVYAKVEPRKQPQDDDVLPADILSYPETTEMQTTADTLSYPETTEMQPTADILSYPETTEMQPTSDILSYPETTDLQPTANMPIHIPVEESTSLRAPSASPELSIPTKEEQICTTPPKSSSPRTVEGFITSVDLNTPEESFSTNLAINQSTDFFNGGQIEQSSGPFSVYVSSSPEPASIETPPVQHQSIMDDVITESPSNPDVVVSTVIGEEESHSVEIVHAQSMVEVTTEGEGEAGEEPQFVPKEIDLMPDIMTQSFSGEQLPEEAYIPSEVVSNMTQSLTESSQLPIISSSLIEVNGTNEINLGISSDKQAIITSSECVEPLVDEEFNFLDNIPVSMSEVIDPVIEVLSKPLEAQIVLLSPNELDTDMSDLQSKTNVPSSELENEASTMNVEYVQPEIAPVVTDIKEENSPISEPLIDHIIEHSDIVQEPIMEKESSEILSREAVPDISTEEPVIAKPLDEPEPQQITSELPPTKPTSQTKQPITKTAPKPAARTTSLRSKAPVLKSIAGKDSPKTAPGLKPSPLRASPKVEEKKTVPTTRVATATRATPKLAQKPAAVKTTTTTKAPIPSTRTAATKPTTTATSRPAMRKVIPATTSKAASTTAKPASTLPSKTTTTTKRVPLSIRSSVTTSKTVSPSAPSSAKSTITTTTSTRTTTSTTTRRPLSAPRPTASSVARTAPATKDSKNTTNKILSTTQPTSLSSTRPPLTTSVSNRTRVQTTKSTTMTTASQKRILSSKTSSTTTTGLKSKKDVKPCPGKTLTPTSKTKPVADEVVLSNGENKIVEEESSIEVKEKLMIETTSTDEQVIETSQELIVNGNH